MHIAAVRNIILACAILFSATASAAANSTANDLAALQGESIRIAAEAQAKERALTAAERELSELDANKGKKEAAVAGRRTRLDTLMQGLVKLGSVPPEVAAAMPGQYGDEVRTASVLKAATETLNEEKTLFEKELEEMAVLERDIKARRAALKAEALELQRHLDSLRTKLSMRQNAYGKLRRDYTAKREKIAAQSKKNSSNVGTLLGALEKAPPEKPARLRSFGEAKGKARIPAAGTLTRRFGDKDALGARAKGITLETRKAAPVTAPYDGEVVYAGEFLGYGQMVILRHIGGYHSLLAGLGEIECVPGQLLLEGEPVGAMGGGLFEKPSLYVEFRASGTPIDPLPWLQGNAALAQN